MGRKTSRVHELPIHTGPEEVHVHPRPTGRKRLDLLLAIGAISISLMSLIVAAGNERTQRQLVVANSWPFPVAGLSEDRTDDGDVLTLSLINEGIGPARVKWVQMTLDGRPIRSKADFVRDCCGIPAEGVEAFVHDGLTGYTRLDGVVPARERDTYMVWRRTPSNASRWRLLRAAAARLAFRSCYCSALDQCWTSDLSTAGDPRPTGTCPEPGPAYVG